MDYTKIPLELQKLNQWVLYSNKGNRKVPINPNPVNGEYKYARVNEPDTWGSFETCIEKVENFDGLGFVFTAKDPYVFIDLDNVNFKSPSKPHAKILELFKSYTEFSVSGAGLHIICKGNFTDSGRRNNVEIYGDKRFAVMTGDIYGGRKEILDCSDIVTLLCKEMGVYPGPPLVVEEQSSLELIPDDDLIELLKQKFGVRFTELFAGEWDLLFPSQSEADLCLINMLVQCTQAHGQIKRIFRRSGLGQREKAQREDYLDRTIATVITNTDQYKFEPQKVAEVVHEVLHSRDNTSLEYSKYLPDGLIKDITNYIFATAIRPVWEIAFCAALTLFAAITGRVYNISNTGLNLYLLLLAPTGTGKEGAAVGIDMLCSYLRPVAPLIDTFAGPKSYASGPALIKTLAKKPSMYSLLGEFGYTMQSLTCPGMNSTMLGLKQALLDVYQKSGRYSVLKSSAYATEEKAIGQVSAPCLTLLGESTPSTFYEGITEASITDGLLPRFSIIEYRGDRPPRNKLGQNVPPNENLIKEMGALITHVMQLAGSNNFLEVPATDEALDVLDDFDVYCDEQIRGNIDVNRHMWNRGHLKALKLAALFAVSANFRNPKITEQHANYAVHFVKTEITNLVAKFISGQLGEDNTPNFEIRQCVKAYIKMSLDERLSKEIPPQLVPTNYIPKTYLSRYLRKQVYFKRHAVGPVRASELALDEAVADGVLVRVPIEILEQQTGLKVMAFTVGPNF